jgi:hypothetical protein
MNLSEVDSFETPCKFCVFAQWDGNEQTGCAANRLESFKPENVIEATDNEFDFFVIKEFCNSYRTKDWNNGDANVRKMQQENAISFTLIFQVDLFSKYELGLLRDNLKKINYTPSKVQIIIVHSARFRHKDCVVKLANTITDCGFSYNIVECLFDDDDAIKETMSHVVKKINKSFYCVYYDPEVSEDSMTKVNDLITKSYLKKVVFNVENLLFVNSVVMKKYYLSDYDSSLVSIIEQSKTQNMYWEI